MYEHRIMKCKEKKSAIAQMCEKMVPKFEKDLRKYYFRCQMCVFGHYIQKINEIMKRMNKWNNFYVIVLNS